MRAILSTTISMIPRATPAVPSTGPGPTTVPRVQGLHSGHLLLNLLRQRSAVRMWRPPLLLLLPLLLLHLARSVEHVSIGLLRSSNVSRRACH